MSRASGSAESRKRATKGSTKGNAQTSILHNIREFFETNPGVFILGGILSLSATLITIATLIGILNDLRDRTEERAERAWTHLTAQRGGQSGKGRALNTLIAAGEPVRDIDLSCQTIGGWRDDYCQNPANLSGFKILIPEDEQADNAHTASMHNTLPASSTPIFNGNWISDSDLSSVVLNSERFRETYFVRTNLRSAYLLEDLDNTSVDVSDLSGSHIKIGNLRDVMRSNLSNTIMREADTLQKDSPGVAPHIAFDENSFGYANWFWADEPPLTEIWQYRREVDDYNVKVAWFLPVRTKELIICDPKYRDRSQPGFLEGLAGLWQAEKIDTGEHFPALRPGLNLGVFETCPAISYQEARARYPAAYDPRPRAP